MTTRRKRKTSRDDFFYDLSKEKGFWRWSVRDDEDIMFKSKPFRRLNDASYECFIVAGVKHDDWDEYEEEFGKPKTRPFYTAPVSCLSGGRSSR